ncbi:uroporphyrinogen-III synthase [Mesorhizobium sp. SB112]|uniref:uroporphyrinogen-III synthase n=1 Tax=Mesorhizobium sp. SB112 TaxID=3151853 RepID=UPI003262EC38
MGRTVLVTRPEPGAGRTARRLESEGFVPIVLPLSQTCRIDAELPPLPFSFILAATSANAFRFAPALSGVKDVACYVVGARTGAAVREAGLSSIVEGEGDAEALADLIIAREKSGQTIVYLCGRVRMPVFESRLREAGFDVLAVETYDTLPLKHETQTLADAFSGRQIDAVLLYSAHAASAFISMLQGSEFAGLFAESKLLCLSKRVADRISGNDLDIRIAETPTEDALFSALGRSF